MSAAESNKSSKMVTKCEYGNDWNLGDHERGDGNATPGKSTDHHDQKKARKITSAQRFEGPQTQGAK